MTIVTPTYNHARFIGACIESAIAQTYPHWEMIVVDDGSTDGTADAAESSGDSRVRVLRQENQGLDRLAETYNRGVGASEGKLVAILEGDDFWPPEKLAIQVQDFSDERVVLSSGRFTMVGEDGTHQGEMPRDLPPRHQMRNEPVGSAFFGLFHLTHLTFTWPAATVVRRSALSRIGGFRQPSSLPIVDLPTFGRLAFEGPFVFHEDRSLGYWRRHGGSASRRNLVRQLTGVHRLAFDLLREHGAALQDRDSVDRLDEMWASHQVHRILTLAKMMRAQGRWREARELCARSFLFRGGPRRTLKRAAAWAAAALRLGSGQGEERLDGGDIWLDESLMEHLPEPLDLVEAWCAAGGDGSQDFDSPASP